MALGHLGFRCQAAVPAVQRVPDHVAEIAGHRGGGPDRIGVLQIAFRDELQRLGRGLRDCRARQVRGDQHCAGCRKHVASFHWCPPGCMDRTPVIARSEATKQSPSRCALRWRLPRRCAPTKTRLSTVMAGLVPAIRRGTTCRERMAGTSPAMTKTGWFHPGRVGHHRPVWNSQ